MPPLRHRSLVASHCPRPPRHKLFSFQWIIALGSIVQEEPGYELQRYVENGSLANIIKPNKFEPIPESLVALYIAQVLEGLVYLHEQVSFIEISRAQIY
ncbi:hypothetical protein ZEAMMB73_Zm00001d033806 [Zea mays]|uniref:non-specific serine/threonine protein kinase n=1 Tax=Zea mays TaxID=4577 RepID=A0A1D6L2J5_MAIZE|nr:hypothetical protein ZEAMMB73_Zm00001d033806 [Zea mays]